jgi:superfamily II DNA/RNA helicase
MPEQQKKQQQILAKLGIEKLNTMQIEAHQAISSGDEVVLLSPTGTGKTLAFLLPLLDSLDATLEEVQLLVLVPSRELAIQIEQVCRDMGSGFKVNAVYGGRASYKDKNDLKHPPAILIGTPGRVADHIRSEVLDTHYIKTLVLDEFDKSLETGFEKEMKEIITSIPGLEKRILTSATHNVQIPKFVGLHHPNYLRFLQEEEDKEKLGLKIVESSAIDELGTLAMLLGHIGQGRGIVFCNLKDTIQTVSSFLQRKKIPHICFFGGMDQLDREHALIKFRNGTHRILIATDLAARGIDVPELDFIIHFEIPFDEASFVHRNGRTARMHKDGTGFHH